MRFYDKLKDTFLGNKGKNKAGAESPAFSASKAGTSASTGVSIQTALEPQKQTTINPAEQSGQRMMFIMLEGASGAREYAYLMFDTEIEKDVMELFNVHKAIHPYAAVIYAGDGDPSPQVKEHINMLYGFDTDRVLQAA